MDRLDCMASARPPFGFNNACFLRSLRVAVGYAGILIVLCVGRSALADFLIVPPLDATVLITESGPPNAAIDKIIVLDKPAFTGKFYGQSRTQFHVSENGNINFANNPSFFTDRLDSAPNQSAFSGGLIAPFWDDFLLVTGLTNAVLDHSVSGDYLAVSWRNVRSFWDAPSGSTATESTRGVQVVWFERSMNYRGFEFMKDDLAFSYVAHQQSDPKFGDYFEATVGVADGGSRYTALPPSTPGGNDTGGAILVADTNRLALVDNSFLLFRPQYAQNGDVTNYISSLEFVTAIPEPNASVLVGVGIVVAMFGRRAFICSQSSRGP
jgi:hypothetical protein